MLNHRKLVALLVVFFFVAVTSAGAQTLGSLNEYQSALYLECTTVGSAGFLGAVRRPNLLTDESKLNTQAMAQFPQLTALQGLAPVQLGCLGTETLRDYTKQTFPPATIIPPCPANALGGFCAGTGPTGVSYNVPAGYPGEFVGNNVKTGKSLTSFLGMDSGACLTLAAGYTVSDQSTINTSCSLPQ